MDASTLQRTAGLEAVGVAFYRMTLPNVGPQETDAMVRMQAETRLPLSADQMGLDWKTIEVTDAERSAVVAAMRKNSPKLMAAVNEFVKDHKQGTLMGNILIKRYFEDSDYITNSIYNEHMQRFNLTVRFFKKYGELYDFDHLMLAALAYQESKLDQNLKSQAGAVGVMQILPSTAKDKNVGIPDVYNLDPNIHAGTKYLRFMADNYFAKDPGLDQRNRALFSFASYNAGPAKVARMRAEAALFLSLFIRQFDHSGQSLPRHW